MVKNMIIAVVMLASLVSSAYAENSKKLVALLLDETGSMQCRSLETTREYNRFIKKLDNGTDFYLARFNSGKYDHFDAPLESSKVGFLEDFSPENNTPLNDSIYRFLKAVEQYDGYSKVIIGILTDGEENSSTKYSQDDVVKLIEEKKSLGWDISYMAVKLDDNDKDSFRQAVGYNFVPSNRTNFISGTIGGVISTDSCTVALTSWSDRIKSRKDT